MKKSLCLVFVVFLTSSIVSAAGGKIIFNLYGNCLDMAKNNYTDQASQYKVFFEVKAAVTVWDNMYIWASHGYFPLRDSWTTWDSKNSFTKDINVERKLAKRIISGGCGFFAGYLEQKQIAVRLEIGICSVTNTIQSTVSNIDTAEFIRAEKAKQSTIGLRGNLAVTYGLYKSIFAEIEGGYIYASDKIDSVRSNLGGFHLALGLGILL
jgi:hypothetical protein